MKEMPEMPDVLEIEAIVEVNVETYECNHCSTPITDLFVKVNDSWVCRLTLHVAPIPELLDWFKEAIPVFHELHDLLKEKDCLVSGEEERKHMHDGGHNVH